jgi:hypothetical protein
VASLTLSSCRSTQVAPCFDLLEVIPVAETYQGSDVKDPLDTTTVKIQHFVKAEFDQLLADLYTNGIRVTANEELVGALVLAARRAAIGEVKVAVSRYWQQAAAIESGASEVRDAEVP